MDDQRHPYGDDELLRRRWEFLAQLDALLDKPLLVLSVLWVTFLVLEVTRGIGPMLQNIVWAIWAVFVLDFLLGLVIAPDRKVYLRQNWLVALSLMVPAFRLLRLLRILRVLRTASALRSVSLVRVLTSVNRGMSAVRTATGARGIGYVAALTIVVTLGGAAGMLLFESPGALRTAGVPDTETANAIDSYSEAVWWTAMVMTTLGSDYFPKTPQGRILGWLLALYAFAIFGYITASIASLLIHPSQSLRTPSPTADELKALREEVAALRSQLAGRSPGGQEGRGDKEAP